MNAIALLSGWGYQRGVSNDPSSASASRRASLSRHNDDAAGVEDGEGEHTDEALKLDRNRTDGAQALQEDTDGQYAEGSTSGIQSSSASPSTSTHIDDLTRQVKPPEAAAYEEMEESLSHTNPLSDASSIDPASIYPTPPASRTSTPTDAIDEAASLQNGNGIQHSTGSSSSSSREYNVQKASIPASRFQGKLFRRQVSPQQSQSHDEVRTSSQQRRVSERHTRALVRSFPVRCIARIYMLLRRFFALFGIQLQAVPALSSTTTQAPSLAVPILSIPPVQGPEDAPPPYSDINKPDPNEEEVHRAIPATRQPRWKFGSLLSRKKASDYLNDKDSPSTATEGYASTSSDEWTGSEEKKLLRKSKSSINQSSAIPDPSSLGHAKTASIKASVAQLALSKPKLLVLDLDETLIHSTSRMHYASSAVTSSGDGRSTWNANTSGLKVRVVEVVLDGRSVIYHVYKRPWVDFFLRKVSSWYTVVIFTASLKEYADPVIDWLDQGRGMISSRLFRESCTYVNGSYLKDLSIVDKDLARVCLVDNSPISYANDPANGIPIEGWINDPNDEALLDLLPMLDSLRFTNDVRHVLALRLATTSTAVSSSAAKARRRRTSTLMGGDSVEQAAVNRAVQSHTKTD